MSTAYTLIRHWQNSKRYIRTLGLVALVYFGGPITALLAWPVWLWLTIEGILRYLPLAAQLILIVWLGWQLDIVQQWSLGSGVLLLLVLQAVIFIARLPRAPFTQAAARLVMFTFFVIFTQRWWPTGLLSEVLQIAAYAFLLGVNLYRRMRG